MSAPKPWKLDVDYDDRGVPYDVIRAGNRTLVKEVDATPEELRLMLTAPIVLESHHNLFASCRELLVLVQLKYGNLDPDVNAIVEKAEAAIKAA